MYTVLINNQQSFDNIATNIKCGFCKTTLMEQGIISDHAGVWAELSRVIKSSFTNNKPPHRRCLANSLSDVI